MSRSTSTPLSRRAGWLVTTVALGAVSLTAAPTAAQASSVWDGVAACESGGNWSINTGNGYYGGLQFHPTTWDGFGGERYADNAHQASKSQQIAIAQRVLAVQGPGAWPVCSVRAGLTRTNGGATYSSPPSRTPSAASRSARSSSKGIAVDGVLGPQTWSAVERWVGKAADGSFSTSDKAALQRKLGVPADGVFGPQSTRALQARVGAGVDGAWGPQTTAALQRYLNAHG